jgi:hypothetical protein
MIGSRRGTLRSSLSLYVSRAAVQRIPFGSHLRIQIAEVRASRPQPCQGDIVLMALNSDRQHDTRPALSAVQRSNPTG